MANEIELKLAFPAAALPSILAHPLIAAAPRKGEPRTLDNTYFDTAELRLHSERIAVRTRRMGKTVLQTVKCAAESVGGLSSRPEWEQPFAGQFDFSAVDIKPVRKLLQGHLDDLLPVFTTVFHRETRIVQPVPEVSILVMIDTGSIIAGEQQSPICELELELAQGAASDLQNFAIALAEDLPLIPFDLSKAQRGYQLFLKETVKPQRFGKTPVQAEHTPLQAYRAIALQGQAAWLANLHGALGSHEPEFLHQFRVSLRRLKALLKTCKPILPATFVERWAGTFSQLANVSGAARDLDVLREVLLMPLLCSEAETAIEPLMQRALRDCAEEREAAYTALQAEQHGVHLLTFSKELHHLTQSETPQSLALFARQRLKRLHARAGRRLNAVAQNPTGEMVHRLRIACKNLRYSCEYFAPVLNTEVQARFLKDLSALQDELGFLHDLEVGLQRMAQWAEEDPALLEAREHVAQWHAERAAKAMAKITTDTRSLLAGPTPWQKAR